MKVGILGGSFDPVHLGHLNLGISLQEACGLDEVLFVVNHLSAFKVEKPPKASAKDRLKLVELAVKHIPGFSVLDWEVKGEGVSYTIDTVRRLKEERGCELHVLIGQDQAAEFSKWKEAEELIRLAPPLVGARVGTSSSSDRFQRVPIPLYDISSTRIRERLAQKQCCVHLLPKEVLDYILEHRLY